MFYLFSICYAEVQLPPQHKLILRSEGHSKNTSRIIYYFSPACPACYKYEFGGKSDWEKILDHFVKNDKITVYYHPILMQAKEKEQIAILSILYASSKDFKTHLKAIMASHDLWMNDEIDELLKALYAKNHMKKEEVFKLLSTSKKDPYCAVKLAALLAEFSPQEIIDGINNKAFQETLRYVVDHPISNSKNGDIEIMDLEKIQNLPTFDVYINGSRKFYEDPVKYGQIDSFFQ